MIVKKKSNYIYLAGNISHDPRTYEWREEFIKLMAEEIEKELVVIVNPCANAFNQGIKGFGTDGTSFIKEAVKRSQRLLRSKDYQLIKMCNLMVANLGLVTPDKPLIGTVQELAWATDVFYMPVIGITEGVENPFTLHPWLDECCSAKVDTAEEAAVLVKTFFLEY